MCQTLFSISISKWHCLCQQWSELFQLKEIVVQWTCWMGQSQRTSFSYKMNCSIVCKKHLPPIASFSNRKNWRLSYLLTENTHVFSDLRNFFKGILRALDRKNLYFELSRCNSFIAKGSICISALILNIQKINNLTCVSKKRLNIFTNKRVTPFAI